jgi:hypothetical protein
VPACSWRHDDYFLSGETGETGETGDTVGGLTEFALRRTAQWPVGGISDADFEGFLALFAARFSLRVLACFFRSSL